MTGAAYQANRGFSRLFRTNLPHLCVIVAAAWMGMPKTMGVSREGGMGVGWRDALGHAHMPQVTPYSHPPDIAIRANPDNATWQRWPDTDRLCLGELRHVAPKPAQPPLPTTTFYQAHGCCCHACDRWDQTSAQRVAFPASKVG
jgi:hypothetical protein